MIRLMQERGRDSLMYGHCESTHSRRKHDNELCYKILIPAELLSIQAPFSTTRLVGVGVTTGFAEKAGVTNIKLSPGTGEFKSHPEDLQCSGFWGLALQPEISGSARLAPRLIAANPPCLQSGIPFANVQAGPL